MGLNERFSGSVPGTYFSVCAFGSLYQYLDAWIEKYNIFLDKGSRWESGLSNSIYTVIIAGSVYREGSHMEELRLTIHIVLSPCKHEILWMYIQQCFVYTDYMIPAISFWAEGCLYCKLETWFSAQDEIITYRIMKNN